MEHGRSIEPAVCLAAARDGDRGADPGRVRLGRRPATRRDAVEYFGRLPRETLRAIVVTLDGRPVGIIGFAKEAFAFQFFSEYKPELEPYLGSVAVLRAIYEALALVRGPCRAYAKAQHAKGAAVLKRLGFHDEGDDTWRFYPVPRG